MQCPLIGSALYFEEAIEVSVVNFKAKIILPAMVYDFAVICIVFPYATLELTI